MAQPNADQELIIEYGPDGRIISISNANPLNRPRNPPQPDVQSPARDSSTTARAETIIDITVDELYQRNITDEQFQTEMNAVSQTYTTPFDDSPNSDNPGLPEPEAIRLPSPVLDTGSILENMEDAAMWDEGLQELIISSVKEDWFTNDYAHYLEDTLQLTKNYYNQLADSIKTNKYPTFWERHVKNKSSIRISELVNCLFADYEMELGVSNISHDWLTKCIKVFFGVPDKIKFSDYLRLVTHESLDSFDSLFINVKEAIALAFISAEMVRTGDVDLKVELVGLLDLLPHSAGILKELSLHSSPEIRIAVVKSLSAINFHQKYTFQSLFRASFDNDCRVRLEFCKVVPEFVMDIDIDLLETDDFETAINVQIAVIRSHISKKDSFPYGELVERVIDIWKHDIFNHVSEEAYNSLKRIGTVSECNS